MSLRAATTTLALLAALGTGYAQQADPAGQAASQPSKEPCVQAKRHDHGAERNVPTPQAKCNPDGSTARRTDGKTDKGHDHGKTHKLM